MAIKRQVSADAFFAAHPVFSVEMAARALQRDGARDAVRNRLRYHVKTGRIRSVTRGIYAVIPTGAEPESFRPDPFLVAVAVRPDAVFSHHSALQLLGAAHSVWNDCTAYSAGPRLLVHLVGSKVTLHQHPTPLRDGDGPKLGTRTVERRGVVLRTTGPERTLVEGFRQPRLVGGIEELINSAGGFTSIELALLVKVLERYSLRRLWAAVGWFLESHAAQFGIEDGDLRPFLENRPRSPLYLVRDSRGGELVSRWNLVLPETFGKGDPDGGER